jgi:hypothetical protein
VTTVPTIVPLLVFEAADCLMAVVASEVGQLEKAGGVQCPAATLVSAEPCTRPLFDLSEYFTGHESDGPWLQWARGTRTAWLRVRRVIDVVPVSLGTLTPLPAVLRAKERTRAFVAAGVRGGEVFLLLDPARLAA